MNPPDPDREEMLRLSAGEDGALDLLMERWKDRVTSYLYRMCGNDSVANDLAEETFVQLYQSRGKYRKDGRFSSWLFGIAANLARHHLRWKGRHPTTRLEESPEPFSEENPGSTAESRERSEAVRKAVSALPEDLRSVLVLSEYQDLTQAEIADIAGCTVKAVERRLSRARELLRRDLAAYLNG